MGNERLSGLDRWRLYRDRLIASPGIQRWALANPLTRPVAQRARAMLDLSRCVPYRSVHAVLCRVRLCLGIVWVLLERAKGFEPSTPTLAK